MHGSNQHRTRRGISLLEVLISIGVLAMGLLGVVALIPAASQQAEEGARNDAGSLAGRRAAREFFVRGMGAAENWNPARHPLPAFPPYIIQPADSASMGAFCLDPYAYATANPPLGYGTSNAPPEIVAFPPRGVDLNLNAALAYGTRIFLPRTTLQRPTAGGPTVGDRWSAAEIEEVFQLQDDLEFVLPKKSSESSVQTMLKALQMVGSQPQPAKRYAKGDFSWFATLVPVVSGAVTQGAYKLSIAIVRQRTPLDVVAVARVRRDGAALPPYITTYGGMGEIELDPSSSIQVRPGEWVMVMNGLSGQMANPNSGVTYQYEWYRVIASDGIHLTVAGDNWNPLPLETICVVPPRVVAVYSRSLPLRYQN